MRRVLEIHEPTISQINDRLRALDANFLELRDYLTALDTFIRYPPILAGGFTSWQVGVPIGGPHIMNLFEHIYRTADPIGAIDTSADTVTITRRGVYAISLSVSGQAVFGGGAGGSVFGEWYVNGVGSGISYQSVGKNIELPVTMGQTIYANVDEPPYTFDFRYSTVGNVSNLDWVQGYADFRLVGDIR